MTYNVFSGTLNLAQSIIVDTSSSTLSAYVCVSRRGPYLCLCSLSSHACPSNRACSTLICRAVSITRVQCILRYYVEKKKKNE